MASKDGWGAPKNGEAEKPAPSFVSIQEQPAPKALKIGIWGSQGTLKTSFCMTMPEPVFVMDTEGGTLGLAKKFYGEKKVYLNVIAETTDSGEFSHLESYNKLKACLRECIRMCKEDPENAPKTIVIDSISDVWEWCAAIMKIEYLNIDPVKKPDQRWDWGIANKKYIDIMTLLKVLTEKYEVNYVVTARAGNQYTSKGQETTLQTPKWQKRTPYWVDMIIHNYIDDNGSKQLYYSKIKKWRGVSNKITGRAIQDSNFEKIMAMKGEVE